MRGLEPSVYCHKQLTGAETRYTQIEKECLVSAWACVKFKKHLYGLDDFKLVSDHKPLVPLMNSKTWIMDLYGARDYSCSL